MRPVSTLLLLRGAPVKRIFYLILQLVIAFAILPLSAIAKLSHRAVTWISMGPYWWCVVHKRRAAGEPEWQEQDFLIGMPPPAGHPYWQSTSLQIEQLREFRPAREQVLGAQVRVSDTDAVAPGCGDVR